jgi:hypothetical protein
LLLLIDRARPAHGYDVKDLATALRTVGKTAQRLQIGLSMLGVAGLLACGGRAIVDQDPVGGGAGPSKPAPTSTGKGSTTRPGTTLPSHELAECVVGFDHEQNPTLPCRWLTEFGMCFDDTEAACACICPRDRDSVCSHGFDRGPDAASLVYCY